MAIKVADGFEITTNIAVDKRFRFTTIAQRDALSSLERYEGLVTYVEEGSLLCHLKGGIENTHWSPVGEGNVSGPISTNDERLVRWDGVTGKAIQSSDAILDDSGNLSGLESVTTTALNIDLMRINESIDSSATGENAMIIANNSRVILTNVSLVSISGISATTSGKVTTIVNKTGKSIRVVHNYSGFLLDNRFTLPDGKDIDLKPDSSITVARSASYGSHIVQGGSGSGGGQTLDTIMQLTADEALSDWTFINDDLSISKVDPLFGDASYELAMVNLAAATYKVVPVDIGFRGTTIALTLNYLMPQGAARVELLDQDNALIDGATFDIPAANGKEKFGTTVFIPSNVTGIRFKAESRATVAEQVFKFDNVQLSADLLKSVDIGDKWQQIKAASSFTSSPDNEGNSSLFKVIDANTIEFLTEADVSANATISSSAVAGGNLVLNLYHTRGGVEVARILGAKQTTSNFTQRENASISRRVFQGDRFFFEMSTNGTVGTVTHERNLLATARTKSIVAPTDQVTERSIAFRWRSPAEATEANLSATGQIGDFLTGQYAINTNTLTQCITAPDQSLADMSVNGLRIYTRAYNAASTAALPARIVIKIAEPNQMAACDLTLFKGVTRQISGVLEYRFDGIGSARGFYTHGFNPVTGLLTIDGGITFLNTTAHDLAFEDNSTQNNGYICFTASKLAQGVAIPTPARYVVKKYQSGNAWYEVYDDGWVRQENTATSGDTSTGAIHSLLIPMRDNAVVKPWFYSVDVTLSASSRTIQAFNATKTNFRSIGIGGATTFLAYGFTWKVEGYGDSATVKSHGARPNY